MKTEIVEPNAHGDGITCFGPSSHYPPDKNVFVGETIVIEDTVVDFTDLFSEEYDGGIDASIGANVIIRRCKVVNVAKALLLGNEEGSATVLIEDSVIDGAGRRCPEAQTVGTKVTMRRCIIRNWGRTFDVRSFGAWAHHGGSIRAESCVFIQEKFLHWYLFHDFFFHIGQAWNDGSRRIRDYLLPGVCRGLTAGVGGEVEAINCYKNKWWIVIENHTGPYMSKEEAQRLMKELE